MNDLGWTIAAILGFALACVMIVVWWMSKRTVQVNQEQHNHAAPVTVNAVTESGGLGIAPALIGGVFKLLFAGIALALLVSAVSSLGTGLQSIGQGLGQQAAPQPITIVMPTPAPVPTAILVPTAAPIIVHDQATDFDQIPVLSYVAIAVLASVSVGVWGYVVMLVTRKRPRLRPNVITPPKSQPLNVSAREVFGVANDVKRETVRR